MDLCIIGSGYVGLVSGACFAEVGHHVVCVDNDQRKIDALQAGKIPIYEPGLAAMLDKNRERLHFTTELSEALDRARLLFVAVGTPSRLDQAMDAEMREGARQVAEDDDRSRLHRERPCVPASLGPRQRHNTGLAGILVAIPCNLAGIVGARLDRGHAVSSSVVGSLIRPCAPARFAPAARMSG